MEYNKIELPNRLRPVVEAVKGVDITLFEGSDKDSVTLLTTIPLMFMDDKNSHCGVFSKGYSINYRLVSKLASTYDIRYRYNLGRGFTSQEGGTLQYYVTPHKTSVQECTAGLQLTFIGVHNAGGFDGDSVGCLMSRLRSQGKYPSSMLLNYDEQVYNYHSVLSDWYYDKEGNVIPERKGKVRYFIIKEDRYITGTEEELRIKYPELCYIHNPVNDEVVYNKPMSYTFVKVSND